MKEKEVKLSEEELRAVKYYEGDVVGEDAFWGDSKAYVTLNALFYPGIGTEERRAMEGKYLNPAILSDPNRLIHLCRHLLSACLHASCEKALVTYRVERYADYCEMKEADKTISFTSTSTGGFLKAYGDRKGIALMEFHIPAGTPCLSFAEVMQENYLKEEEKEVLLAPGLELYFTEVPLSQEEKEILDADGKEPVLKAIVEVRGSARPAEEKNLPETADVECGMRVYEKLNAKEKPEKKDIQGYLCFKEAFHKAVLE